MLFITGHLILISEQWVLIEFLWAWAPPYRGQRLSLGMRIQCWGSWKLNRRVCGDRNGCRTQTLVWPTHKRILNRVAFRINLQHLRKSPKYGNYHTLGSFSSIVGGWNDWNEMSWITLLLQMNVLLVSPCWKGEKVVVTFELLTHFWLIESE